MKKRIITMTKVDRPEADDHGFMAGSMAERLSYMWELTQSAWAFVPGYHAEQRLQRHIATLTRRKR